MVKLLDDMQQPELLNHIGWHLWRASNAWNLEFRNCMINAGYHWFSEARSQLVPYVDRGGTRQALLVTRTGLTKQAVQQFVDQLVDDGIVERQTDPDDARGKLVTFTKKGLAMLKAANQIKKDIEKKYRKHLGVQKFDQLCATLVELDTLSGADE